MEVDKNVDEVLKHYGVIGMKWGVSRTPEQLKNARRSKKSSPQGGGGGGGGRDDEDVQWDELSDEEKEAFAKRVGDAKKGETVKLQEFIRAHRAFKGTVDSKGRYTGDTNAPKPTVRTKTTNLTPGIKRNTKKRVRHSDELDPNLDSVLAHYGILGMKWGVRRTPEQISAAKANRRMKKASKKDDSVSLTKVSSDDGSSEYFDKKGRRVSSDAATARALKNRAKREGPQALSNAQMQDLITRMNLEAQYSKLNPKKQNPAVVFATGIVRDAGKQAANQYSAKYSKQLADALMARTEKKK